MYEKSLFWPLRNGPLLGGIAMLYAVGIGYGIGTMLLLV